MESRTLRSLSCLAVAGLVAATACQSEQEIVSPGSAALAKGGGGGGGAARYQLRFIVEDETQGEITSDLFPAGGVQLNSKDPWKNLSVSGATWTFNNYTHGVRGEGGCSVATDIDVNWDIATAPDRSFEGEWAGTVSFWRPGKDMNFYFEAQRPENPNARIRNIASNGNITEEERAPDQSYYRIRFRNARLGFGGASSPDGQGSLDQLPGYESACANFTVEAVRMP